MLFGVCLDSCFGVVCVLLVWFVWVFMLFGEGFCLESFFLGCVCFLEFLLLGLFLLRFLGCFSVFTCL